MERNQFLRVITIIALGLSILVLFILLLVPDSPVQQWTLSFMTWISEIPTLWGCVLITLIYAVSLIFCFPGTPINLAAGFLFGPLLGSVATVIGCDLGAIFSFIIGRTLTREWAETKMKSNKTYSQIDIAVSKNGLLIIFLLRLSPVIPFGICNYIFGATNITFSKYWLATTAGLIPCTVAYTYFGSLMRSLTDIYSDKSKESTDQLFLIGIAIILTTAIIVVITVVTKRTLKKAMEEQEFNEAVDLEKAYELTLIEEDDESTSNITTINMISDGEDEDMKKDLGTTTIEYTFDYKDNRASTDHDDSNGGITGAEKDSDNILNDDDDNLSPRKQSKQFLLKNILHSPKTTILSNIRNNNGSSSNGYIPIDTIKLQ
ncbi:hypothetical protein CYY_000975 [Polysphondylium violaceum]|uniref:VTT domain-containing protein n=1 Tax=Polysphondylium violaceum TaxID=133409 RepID=A0A8J4V538_9MYCE|nr:hypothetical protein CYY_000975 [Polysphondylium violaceum]